MDATPTYSHAQILRVIIGILLCMVIAALDQTVVIPAVPAIARDLHSYDHLAWIVTAYLLTSTAATPIFGKLSDTHGRRALMTPAIALFIVASILCALSRTLTELILARGLQGIGGGGLFAMAQAAIADVVSPRERGRYQGYLAGSWAFASIAGPLVGGYVTDDLSWRYIFWFNLPLGLLAMYLTDRGLRLLVVIPRRSRIDSLGASLLIGGISALLLMLSWGGSTYGWLSPEVLGLLALGLALLTALYFQEHRAPDPLLPPRLFHNDIFLNGVAVAALSALGLFVATFLLPLEFQLLRGYDAETSGLLVMPYLVSSSAGAFLAGSMTRRFGKSKMVILAGLACADTGFFLLATNNVDTSAILILLESTILGTGLGMCGPSATVAIQNAVERRDVGAATGALLLLRSMGGAFGSTLAGALLTARIASTMQAAGIRQSLDLSALSQSTAALTTLPPATRQAALHGLANGFDLAYLVTAILLILGLALTIRLRDAPLRTTSANDPPTIGH